MLMTRSYYRSWVFPTLATVLPGLGAILPCPAAITISAKLLDSNDYSCVFEASQKHGHMRGFVIYFQNV